ncbi:MAG: hypothetical protein KGJ30_20610 [Burkholderiales bacterium]|nr:hypothetical protein [Burkholderiales bacterium]MDE1929079.1 hypothetical protein [Burkholderiales bacterium]MDE2161318.1 hypothetical protein [Burkholderiales bacterium]
MGHPTSTPPGAAQAASHELCFLSLYRPGTGVVVPCDPAGQVDLDALPERLRLSYFGARALIGREYAYPVVQPAH